MKRPALSNNKQIVLTLEDLSRTITEAVHAASDRVASEADAARKEVERELDRFNAERDRKNDDISVRVKEYADDAKNALAAHTALEDARFVSVEKNTDAIRAQLVEIAADVKSLLGSRSFTQGAWRAMTIVAGAVSLFMSLIVAVVMRLWR